MRENFDDPESRSSSGATDVPCQTSKILSPMSLPRFDSGLPRKTQNCTGIIGNVFERPLVSIQRIWHLHLRIWDLLFQRQQGEKERWKESHWIRRLNHLTSEVEVECWIMLVELILTVVWWIIREFFLRNGILENFLTLWNFKAGRWTSELRFVFEQPILRSKSSGSKKLRLLNQVTNLWHRDRSQGSLIFLISIWLMRLLRQPWRSFSTRSQICRKRVSVEEQRAQNSDRFLRGRQIAYMIYEYFCATGAYEAVQGLADLFTMSLQNDNV